MNQSIHYKIIIICFDISKSLQFLKFFFKICFTSLLSSVCSNTVIPLNEYAKLSFINRGIPSRPSRRGVVCDDVVRVRERGGRAVRNGGGRVRRRRRQL